MAMRRSNRSDDYGASSTPKRRRSAHQVSDSDDGEFDSDDECSSVGQFTNQGDFLRAFGGYNSDDSYDDHHDEGN
jgi:hypothetical protein